MIRPVLYVDLPGIIYAIDHRARSKQHEYAHFVCWLEPVENALPPPPLLRNILPLHPTARTWICEDHWHILGFAQVRERPAHTAWDLSYLASMANNRHQTSDEVLAALLEYTLEMAAMHGIIRIFARVEDDLPELDLFQRAGFQRYARELTYVYDPAANLMSDKSGESHTSASMGKGIPGLRNWDRHYSWGLYQLYRAVTPNRVIAAEQVENSEEFAKLTVGSSWPAVLTKSSQNYICDAGVRLGGWIRLYRGYGSVPHRLALLVHPEHAELAGPLLQFSISRLLEFGERRIYCLVREYDTIVVTALRERGFEQASTKILLVRQVASLATWPSAVPQLESRAIYGLKGLGAINSQQNSYATI